MHAAGERAPLLEGGVAVVTAAGRAVTTDTVVRAAVLTPKIGTTKVFWAIWTDRSDLSYEPVRLV